MYTYGAVLPAAGTTARFSVVGVGVVHANVKVLFPNGMGTEPLPDISASW